MPTCPIIYDFGKKTPNFFLSSFYPVLITVAFEVPGSEPVNETYASVEHAYQAAKTYVAGERESLRTPGLAAGMAKRMGQFVTIRKNWESSKVTVMLQLLTIKFQRTDLRERLLSTAPKMLIEGNYWHDNFWGVCMCPRTIKGCQGASGTNNLGKLLMNLRRELQNRPEIHPIVTTNQVTV